MTSIQDQIRAAAFELRNRTGEEGNIILLGSRAWQQFVDELGGQIPMHYDGMEFVNPSLLDPDNIEVVRWDEEYLRRARAYTRKKVG